MTILAIDTSTDYLSLAILKEGKLIARFHKRAKMRHSVLLVPMIDKLLKNAKLKIKDIDCLAISIGPGSFTGLRIGVTVVKGLSYALKKPVVVVPTLDVIAMNAKKFTGVICPVLDARKNKVYACLYKSDAKSIKKISKYLLLPLDDLLKKIKKYDKVLFLGDAVTSPFFHPGGEQVVYDMHTPGVEKGIESKVYKDWHPKAQTVAQLASEYFKQKKFVRAHDLEPMYLYSKECDIKGR